MSPNTRRRTLVLRERTPRAVRLAEADVAFLLAEHGSHVVLAPTGVRGRFQVTPAGHVGTIVCPTCRLVIRPKVPLDNLFQMLDPDGTLSVVQDQTTVAPGDEALDFLASRLVQLLQERTAAGLHRAYTERADAGPFLHGRLDIAAQLRDPSGRKDQLHCRYEEFTVDVPCNQVPRATAELLLRSPLIADGPRAGLRRALLPLDGVSSIALGPDSFHAAAPDRLTEPYRPLLDLCRLLADSLSPGETAGATPGPAFLLDMERVFERYVTRGVVAAFAGRRRFTAQVQPLHRANVPTAGQPDLLLRPDVVVERAGRPVLVVDAKWKRLAGSPLVTEDVYQVLAYCTALGVPRAVLVYPGPRDRGWRYRLARAPVEVEVRMLRVSGPRDVCARSVRRLGRQLRSVL